MRPLPGDDARGRPHTSDSDGPSTFRLPPASQMTYFLTDEASMGSSSPPPPAAYHRAKEHKIVPPAETPDHSKPRAPPSPTLERDKETSIRPSSSKTPVDAPKQERGPSRSISPFPGPSDTPNISQPPTPMFFGVSGPASALSSVSSRRNSLCLSEDLGSRPPSMRDGDIAVEDEEEQAEEAGASCSSMVDSGSAPQLIMPSIKMPSRRPFTDEGKRTGRLKLLIAGDSGVGKTSLIKAIVQSCEHIVHVDPITPSALMSPSLTRSIPTSAVMPRSRQRGSRRQSSKESTGTSQITEIYASTKPYPEWWSEVDDLRVLRRRKSLGDAVLDRNICFVDTPGYGNGSSAMDTITPVVRYIEAHLQRINSNFLHDGDLLNLLGGEGGVQVDAVFYMVLNRLEPVDIEYLRQLAPLTNIIILVAQTDLVSTEQVAASKDQIYSQLKEANIRPFSFSIPSSNYPTSSDPDKQGVYAISSATGSDHDTMEASLLMSPDYVQPLIPTELAALVEQVFSSNGVSWLRHSVARKYVQWRKAENDDDSTPSSSSSKLPPSRPLNQAFPFPDHQHLRSPVITPPVGATSSYALARLADHTQREERLAQVRLANWAADLQRSLARERDEYAALARAERAVWLAERIGECVREGGLVAVTSNNNTARGRGRGRSCSQRQRQGQQQRGGDFTYEVGVVEGFGLPEVGPGSGLSPTGGRASKRGEGKRGHGQGVHAHQNLIQSQSQSRRRQRHSQDPLGLLEVADELRHKGLVALEVLGSLGVLGGLALWVTRHYLHLEWERFWYGGSR